MRRVVFALCAFGAFIAWQSACRAPTEILVRVTTDFDCALLAGNEVTARFGSDFATSGAVASTSKACANHYAGTLVLTPSGRGDHVTVEVMAAIAPASLDADGTCKEGDPGCIHVRRSLPYLANTPLTVPITLEQVCAGHPCALDETCIAGQCVANSIDPSTCDASDCQLPPPGTTPLAAECGDTSALQLGAPYPTSAGCSGRTNVSTEHGPAIAPSTGPSFAVDGDPINAVIDKDNVAYVTTIAGNLYAFTLDPPAQKWGPKTLQATPLVSLSGSLAIAASGVLYAANDSEVHAFSTADGSEVEAPVSAIGQITSDMIMIASNLLVFTDNASHVESIGTGPFKPGNTGTLASSAFGYSVTSFGNRLWVGDNLGELWAVDATSMQPQGNPLQRDATYIQALGAPDGLLRVASTNATSFTIAAIDPNDLTQTWGQTLQSTSGNQGVAVTPDGTTWVTDSGTLHTYAKDGTAGPSWADGVRFPGYDVDSNVYFTDATGALTSADKTGKPRWSAATFSDLLYAILVGKNGVLLGLGQQGTVFVYHP